MKGEQKKEHGDDGGKGRVRSGQRGVFKSMLIGRLHALDITFERSFDVRRVRHGS